MKQYIDKIRSYYTKYIKNNLIKYNAWKTQLTMVINFTFSKDTDTKRLMHSKRDQRCLEESLKGCDSVLRIFKM